MTINANATSLALQVFLPSDVSLNPFSDPFIQRMANMDRSELHRIIQLNDSEYALKLLQNNGMSYGKFNRNLLPFRHIFFLFENM